MLIPDAVLEQIDTPDWQLQLGGLGAVVTDVDDITQCLRTILLTPKGSVPMRPDFGADVWRFVDAPISEARPKIVQAALDAIAANEPRVEILSMACGVAAGDGSALLLQLTWRRAGAAGSGTALAVELAQP